MQEIAFLQELRPKDIKIPVEERPLSKVHPTFARLGDSIETKHLQLNYITSGVFAALQEVAKRFPPKCKSQLSREEKLPYQVLPYHAVVITHPPVTPEVKAGSQTPETNVPENYGFIFLSGGLGTAADRANTAAEIFDKAKQQDWPISFSASISSSASFDTLGKKFPRKIIDRAAQQAVLIAELLQKHSCKNLVLAGHSLGGMELHYIIPFLEKLLEKYKLNTKIAGLIFAQAGGQFQQEISWRWKKKIDIFRTLALGLRELFPSPVDVFNKKEQLRLAEEKGNINEVRRHGRELEEIQQKRKNPPYLDEQQKKDLQAIDNLFRRSDENP